MGLTGKTKALPFAIVAVLAAMAFAVMAFTVPAYAENIQMQAPTTVSDDITRLHVNKLDSDTREFVSGATMAIINEETGEVVDSWVTGSSTHENEKGLDVDVVYILRELSAPAGYSAVEDVRFVVNETEGTGITVLSSGSDAELTESYKVNLYDHPLSAQGEMVVTQQVPGASLNVSTTSKAVAPKTGDETPLYVGGIVMVVGITLIAALQLFKRRLDEEE